VLKVVSKYLNASKTQPDLLQLIEVLRDCLRPAQVQPSQPAAFPNALQPRVLPPPKLPLNDDPHLT